jgi:hypothetical protein
LFNQVRSFAQKIIDATITTEANIKTYTDSSTSTGPRGSEELPSNRNESNSSTTHPGGISQPNVHGAESNASLISIKQEVPSSSGLANDVSTIQRLFVELSASVEELKDATDGISKVTHLFILWSVLFQDQTYNLTLICISNNF